MKRLLGLVFMTVTLLGLTMACSGSGASGKSGSSESMPELSQNPKRVFLFIGDGLSFPQIAATEMYLGKISGNDDLEKKNLQFTNFPVEGIVSTYDADSFIPDSASTATSIASGLKTASGVINYDAEKANPYEPITYRVKEKGYKIGIVSSVSIDHATPAAFYASDTSRNNYYTIADQLTTSGFDYFGGGSMRYINGKNGDQPDLFEKAEANGMTIADTVQEIEELNKDSGRILAVNPILSGSSAMHYEMDRDAENDALSLADFVRKGIEVLDNDNGYFLIVESGKIDWASHANDAAATINDTIAFNRAIEEAMNVYEQYPEDTLIIVTGDHETGGMTIGHSSTKYSTYLNVINKQTMSADLFTRKIVNPYVEGKRADAVMLSDLEEDIEKAFGLRFPGSAGSEDDLVLTDYEFQRVQEALIRTVTPEDQQMYTEYEKIAYGSYNPLTTELVHILNSKAGLGYTTYSHSGLPCPIYALGQGAEMFEGSYHNTEIHQKLAYLFGVKPVVLNSRI